MLQKASPLALSPRVCQPGRVSRRLRAIYSACMPIYEYRCTNGHRFEVLQKIADDPITECEECGAPATRVLHPVAIHFKGSGFYSTDYGRGKKSASDSAKSEAGGGSDSKTSSGDSGSSSSSSSDSGSTSKPKAAEA